MRIYKVKKIKPFLAWGKFITQHEPTAKKLLKAENCSREFFYVFKDKGRWYAIGHAEGGPFKEPMNHPINIKHKKILKQCLVPLEKKLVYDIKTSSSGKRVST